MLGVIIKFRYDLVGNQYLLIASTLISRQRNYNYELSPAYRDPECVLL